MATETLARVLLNMLRDEDFARLVLEDSNTALMPYRLDLTDEESAALSRKIDPMDVDYLAIDPHVGAWRLLVHHIDSVPASLRAELNQELAKRATQSIAIPTTGS